jgi:K+-transporting ATPase ATPase C chain
MLKNQIRPAVTLTLVLCVLTGLLYPGVVTGLAQVLFPRQANGSLVTVDGRVVGSALIGQPFTRPEYFHPRPSAAGAGYDGTASAGTNKGPTDRKLADTLIAARGDGSPPTW